MPKAARSTASWESAGTSYPFVVATYRQHISRGSSFLPIHMCIAGKQNISRGCVFLLADIWIMHLETFWAEGSFVLTDGKYICAASSHV